MSDATARVQAPFLAAAQAQKHVTHNEALIAFDALTACRILDRTLSTPPAAPSDGDTYLVKAAGTGLWNGQDGKIAYAIDGGWRFYAPFTGLIAYVSNESQLLIFTAAGWTALPGALVLQNLSELGVGTAADSTNKLAVKSPALLFDNIGAGVQAKLNKTAAGDTASILYQASYTGHAEIGLTGDNDFHFKVSADGSTWHEALTLSAASGAAIISSVSAAALAVGPNGIANPTLNVDSSAAGAATGLNVKGAAAAAGVALSVLSPGANENLAIDAKGSGTITLGGTSAGNIVLSRTLVAAAASFSGNTGIGTVSPQAPLHVSSGADFAAVLKISDSSSGATGALVFGDGGGVGQYVGIWRGNANSAAANGNYLNMGAYAGLVFTAGPTALGSQAERMRIDNSGNIGIGTTNPQYRTHINGALGIAPGNSVTPAGNGDVVFEFTSNTTLTIRAKGSDGTVRSVALTLS